MDFERSDILRPILDDLATNDQTLLWGTQQKVLGEFSSRGMGISSVAAVAVAEALKEVLSKRKDDLLSEMHRVLDGSPVDNFEQLEEGLSLDLASRLKTLGELAASEFLKSTAMIRSGLGNSGLMNALPEHLERLTARLFAEIKLFCVKLHESQKPRLFLKAGEVFAGNRAARKILTSAKQSLDIIDAWLGPEVFDMLELTQHSIKIRLISDKLKNAATKQAYYLFNQQFGQKVEFRLCDPKEIHDRFIIVDGQEALHVGGSIKDLGKSDSLIDAALLEPHKQRFEELWLKAAPVT